MKGGGHSEKKERERERKTNWESERASRGGTGWVGRTHVFLWSDKIGWRCSAVLFLSPYESRRPIFAWLLLSIRSDYFCIPTSPQARSKWQLASWRTWHSTIIFFFFSIHLPLFSCNHSPISHFIAPICFFFLWKMFKDIFQCPFHVHGLSQRVSPKLGTHCVTTLWCIIWIEWLWLHCGLNSFCAYAHHLVLIQACVLLCTLIIQELWNDLNYDLFHILCHWLMTALLHVFC